MNVLLISPWHNCWIDYLKKYVEAKGHTLDYCDKLVVKDVVNYDVLISGWCDEGVKWLSRHPKLCDKYICWVRSYEFWHNNLDSIEFGHFDHVFFVNQYIKDSMRLPQGEMLPNTIDLDKIPYTKHKAGKEILLLADINFKKGIPLLIQLARKLPDYNFNIYGNVTSKRDYLYLRYCNLPNVFVRGYTKDIIKVFNNNDYILLTSPVEGNPNCIIEGMAAGLKPVVHRFVGSDKQFPKECYWDTIDEAVDIINGQYHSKHYRDWVETHYDMWKVYKKLDKILEDK